MAGTGAGAGATRPDDVGGAGGADGFFQGAFGVAGAAEDGRCWPRRPRR